MYPTLGPIKSERVLFPIRGSVVHALQALVGVRVGALAENLRGDRGLTDRPATEKPVFGIVSRVSQNIMRYIGDLSIPISILCSGYLDIISHFNISIFVSI